MTRTETLNKMFSNKMIRITKSFRKYWGIKPLGQWFYIQSYHDDDTVQICSNSTHQIFVNVSITELKS